MLVTKKNLLWMFLLPLVLIITFHLLAVTLRTHYLGISLNNQHGVWTVSNVDSISWGAEQGIQIGDIVLQVDQNPPSSVPTIKKYEIIQDIHSLVISRNGQIKSFNVTGYPTSEQVLYLTVVPFVVFVIFLFFSIFLYSKKRNDTSAVILILFFLSIGISYFSTGGSSRGDTLARLINRLTFLYCPILFLHFLYDYFKRYSMPIVKYYVIQVQYVISGIMVVIDTLYSIGFALGLDYRSLRNVLLAVFLLNFFGCLFTLITSYQKYRKNQHHKAILKILITGITAAFFPFVVLCALPEITFNFEIFPGALGATFLLLLPVFFIYLITANRLLDIDFVINRIRYYSSLSIFPALTVFLFLHFLSRNLTLVENIQITIFIYLLNVVSFYIKENLDFKFRSRLFTEKYNFQASLNQFSNEISKVMKVSDLEQKLIQEVKRVIPSKSCALFEYDKSNCRLTLKNGDTNAPIGLILEQSSQALAIGELIELPRHGLCLMVGNQKDKCYFLWINEKLSSTQFNLDERVWLKTIAHYVSMVYENLLLIEGLVEELEVVMNKKSSPSWVSRLIFNIAEKERRRLAADLHDSALQDQLLWYRELEEIAVNEEVPSLFREKIGKIREGLLDVIHQIREICNELRPPLLKDFGIVETIQTMIENVQLRNNFDVVFQFSGFTVQCDLEQQLAIYRITQELLANASKHSKASKINITLDFQDNSIFLNYQDNGIGMDLQRPLNDLSGKHIGLSGIKERVTSLDGQSRFYSSPGNGLEVLVKIPVIQSLNSIEQSAV